MTLLAAFNLNNISFLFSDILTSANLCQVTRAGEALLKDSPFGGPINARILESQGRMVPFGLRQKLTLFDGRLALSVAGNMKSAADVVEDIKQKLASEPLDYRLAYDAFDRRHRESGGNLAMVGLWLTSPDRTKIFWNGATQKISHQNLGTVVLAGSGADHFRDSIDNMGALRPSRFNNPLVSALGAIGGMVANIVKTELRTRENILSSYGASIEFAFPLEGKLVKFDDYTVIFWEAR